MARDSLPRFLSTEQGFKIRINLLPSSQHAKEPPRASLSTTAGRALRGLILHSSDDSVQSSTHSNSSSSSNSANEDNSSTISMTVLNAGHHVLPSFDSTSSAVNAPVPHTAIGHHSCPSLDSFGHSMVSDGSGPEGDSPRSSLNRGRVPLDRLPSEKTPEC